jgi:polysaccharide biosynthesis transport protein
MTSVYDQVLTILYQIWQRRWHGLVTMWAIALIGWGIVAAVPDVYEAKARIYVDTNRVLTDVIRSNTGNNVLREVDVMRRTLVSRPNLEMVVRRTDMDLTVENDAEMEALITDLGENITLAGQGDDLFEISYQSGDGQLTDQENANLAKRVVQNLINIFVEGPLKGGRDNFVETKRFLQEQIADYERRLEEAEQRKAEFERTNATALASGGMQGLMAKQSELQSIEMQVMEAQSARSSMARQLATIPMSVPSMRGFGGAGPSSGPVEQRVQLLERQVSEAIGRGWTESHPDIVGARQQIAALQRELAQERASAARSGSAGPGMEPNPMYQSMRAALADRDATVTSLNMRAAALRAEITAASANVANAPTLQTEQAKLNRDYNVIYEKYQELLRSRQEAELAGEMDTKTDRVTFRIVDPPEVPLKPVAPDRPLLLTLVMLGALGAGLGIAALMSQVHTTYVSVQHLRSTLNVPVLGNVSAIASQQDKRQARLRLGVFLVLFIGLLAVYGVLMALEINQAAQAL